MAARNTADGKHVGFRTPIKDSEAYFTSVNRTESNISSKFLQPSTLQPVQAPSPLITVRSADITTPRVEIVSPARRVVVIRNTKNAQLAKGPVDLDEIGRSNSAENHPVISDGHKSVYVIRRPITHTAPPKPVESQEPVHEPPPPPPPPVTPLEHIRTPTPPKEIVTSTDLPRAPSPPSSPSIGLNSSKHPENGRRYVPYLRRPRSKPRTASPVHTNSTHRLPSSNQSRPSPPNYRSPSPPLLKQQQEVKDTGRKRGFFSFFSRKTITESTNSPPPVIVETEQVKTTQRKKTTSSRVRSAKSVVLVNPEDQAIVVVENSHVKGEALWPIVKRPKSIKKTHFQDEIDDESTEKLVKRSRCQTCLGCLSRYICLIIIICFILILIGLAGIGVSTYFLINNSSSNLIPTIVGIAVGGVLIIAALCFLCILLGCIGSRDGYFTYNNDGEYVGGRAFALIPPSHPNARLYIPRDYMKMVDNNHPSSITQIPLTRSNSNVVYQRTSSTTAISTIPYTRQNTIYRSNSSINDNETKLNNNITIEMPERLVTGRTLSPRSRERSLNTVVKNIGHIVEDAKKRYNGDVPSKVIVKVDEHSTMQTT